MQIIFQMNKNLLIYFILFISFSEFVFSQTLPQKSFASISALAEGNWFKIGTTKEGVHKISYTDLMEIGVAPPYKSSDFRLFGNGGKMLPEKISEFRFDDLVENAVWVMDGGDGYIDVNDYILFYSEPTYEWKYYSSSNAFFHHKNCYSDSTYYFFSFDKGPGKRIAPYPVINDTADISVSSYNDHLFYELDSINLLKSGKQWVGEVFDAITVRNFYFYIKDIIDSANVSVRVNVLARSLQKSSFQVDISGFSIVDSILPIDGNINSEFARTKTISLSFIPQSDTLKMKLTYNKSEIASKGWLNYIELESVRKLIYRNEQLKIRNLQTIGHNVSEFIFTNSGINFRLWHIADSGNIKEVQLNNNGNITFCKVNTASLNEFIAFDDDHAYHPALLGKVPNQNLHGLPQCELVIITHPQFLPEADRLGDFHRNMDLMKVNVVTTEQVYNEFSSGKQDPVAIRDFVRMFYQRGASDTLHRIKYLLLFGDGSYDMKYRIAFNTNFVPTWQTDNSLYPISSFVSDDFFGMLDPNEGDNLNGDIDIGVGRFPVSTLQEASTLVSKALLYETEQDLVENSQENGLISNLGSWRNNISLIADDEDGNLHFTQTEKLKVLLDSLTDKLIINKIYLDAYKQIHTPSGDKYPEVNTEIDKNIRNGSLLINYIGHGGEYGLASENVLTFAEIGKYSNFYCLPVFVTATCEFSRYDNPELVSAGEKILLNANGGSIAMFSTTRIAFAHSNEIVNRNLMRAAFTPNNNDKVRFGDMIKTAKNLCASGVYKQNFTLLGDPALSLALPKHTVTTEKIMNGNDEITGDTIFNNTAITVSGFIADKNGNKLNWFNGSIVPKVFDKPVMCNTLANDPDQSFPASFEVQQNLIFQGNTSVKNGDFTFSFFIPKDITFGNGFGKIVYYAKNSFFDAGGVTDSLILKNNGINNSADMVGPKIDIFMEDMTFNNGDETSSDPFMYVHLHDTSGINSYGVGIGHEIVAYLDNEINDPVFLNDRFILDTNKFTSGKLSYRFHALSYGEHTLKLSAWDLLNNHSEKEITFTVKSPSDIDLGGIYNYPDPVYENTTFYIESNMSTDIMSVTISIYNVSGILCAEINKNILPGSFKPIEILWDATSSSGQRLSKGFYTYTVALSDKNGKTIIKADKMAIVR